MRKNRKQFKQSGADTYALVAAGLRVGIGARGDITGSQEGTGADKLRKARAVGAGEDPDVQRARLDQEWQDCADLATRAAGITGESPAERAERVAIETELDTLRAERAAIVAEAIAESEEGRRVLTIAGGVGFGNGRKFITMESNGMAARAARYVKSLRGHTPSDTSLQDAGATAAAAMWREWLCYSALCGDEWTTEAITHLARVGWRAAFHSFGKDSARGRTGRESAQSQGGGADVPLDGASLELDRKSLESWARDRQGRLFNDPESEESKVRRARRAVLRWFATVLDIRAKGRTGAAERARFSVLARLVHGRDIATAARGAGFATGRAGVESFRSGKVWARLRSACSLHLGARERRLIAIRRGAVRAAMKAIKSQRAARIGAGRADIATAIPRRVVLTSGASSVRYVPCGFIVTHPAARRAVTPSQAGLTGRGAVHPLARQWSQATSARGQAVALARSARVALVNARRERQAQFETATQGWRRGWLR